MKYMLIAYWDPEGWIYVGASPNLIEGPFFGCSYNEDYSILGSILGVP